MEMNFSYSKFIKLSSRKKLPAIYARDKIIEIAGILIKHWRRLTKRLRDGYSVGGFTLIELLVVISIIGFITAIGVYYLNVVKMQGRDANRTSNIGTLNKAFAIYINEYGDYPISAGECLIASSGVGQDLVTGEMIVSIPADPVTPSTAPAAVGCTVAGGQVTSCPSTGTAQC